MKGCHEHFQKSTKLSHSWLTQNGLALWVLGFWFDLLSCASVLEIPGACNWCPFQNPAKQRRCLKPLGFSQQNVQVKHSICFLGNLCAGAVPFVMHAWCSGPSKTKQNQRDAVDNFREAPSSPKIAPLRMVWLIGSLESWLDLLSCASVPHFVGVWAKSSLQTE